MTEYRFILTDAASFSDIKSFDRFSELSLFFPDASDIVQVREEDSAFHNLALHPAIRSPPG